MLKKLDLYILGKFLKTFFFILGIIMAIACIFDVSEKIDDFLNHNAPLEGIIFDYYLNFIFFYGNMFSPLIVFLSVIFFTSKMASKSEIISILAAGVSFNRLLLPYFVGATLLAGISFYLNHYLVPHASLERLEFEWNYLHDPYRNRDRHIHKQVRPNEFIYMNNYMVRTKTGNQFTYEKFEGDQMVYKLMADFVRWDTSNNKWSVNHYTIRTIEGTEEKIEKGRQFDTTWNFYPDEFARRQTNVQTMDTPELEEFIAEETMKGSELIPFYYIEKYQRTSFPFATYILVLIGVSIASRKVRGGIGLHIAVSLLLCGIYVLSMEVASVFARNAGLSPLVSVWLPNTFFGIIAVYLYFKAQK